MRSKSSVTLLVLLVTGLVATPFPGSAESSPAYFQAANMFVFGSPNTLVPGGATLTRSKGGISFSIQTSGLIASNAYTIWIAIFNAPENCAGGAGACTPADLMTPAVQGSLVFGAGAIAGALGEAGFQGSFPEGAPPTGVEVNPAGFGTVNGLKDSRKAEIHLVIRAHGFILAGDAVTQLTQFACPGCMNVQAVIFEAVK
jgi:hypothetical protein